MLCGRLCLVRSRPVRCAFDQRGLTHRDIANVGNLIVSQTQRCDPAVLHALITRARGEVVSADSLNTDQPAGRMPARRAKGPTASAPAGVRSSGMMGETAQLSAADKNALLAYLETL